MGKWKKNKNKNKNKKQKGKQLHWTLKIVQHETH